jgi:hypothetical protein
MIDVDIRGPVSKKDYERLKKLLTTGGEHSRLEQRITLRYSDRGFNNREVRIEHKNGRDTIYIQTGKLGERKELATELCSRGFSRGVDMFAELGYKKGIVSAQEVLTAVYGGAEFALFDPGEDSFYYEAVMTAKGAAESKEAKGKLEKLARQLKLPVWTPLDMLAFVQKVQERTNYVYDHETLGSRHFEERFGI